MPRSKEGGSISHNEGRGYVLLRFKLVSCSLLTDRFKSSDPLEPGVRIDVDVLACILFAAGMLVVNCI